MQAHKHPKLLLAWLSLGCSVLAVLSTPIFMMVLELQHASMSAWLSWFAMGRNLLVMLALGLALLARDSAPRALPVGVALGASGVLALSSVMNWAGRGITSLIVNI